MRILARRGIARSLAAAVAVGLPLTMAAPAQADPKPAPAHKKLIESVTVGPVKKHLKALQRIADANGGTRASGTPGYDASSEYVADKLRKAGYRVTVQPFEFPYFEEKSTAVMERTAPTPRTYAPTPPDGSAIGEFATMNYSGSGEVTATVQAVDLILPPPAQPGSTSGCEPEDFAGFTPGNIALVQRGTCDFIVKANNAKAAGAVGVIIFNEGQEGRTETFLGSLGTPVDIPVVGTSFAVGEELASLENPVVRLKTDTVSETRTTTNVIADSRWGDPNNTVMLGAHLDSVLAGSGLNDNASGSAAILAVAEKLGKIPTRNKLRFAWWGAEELGLLGSEYYVANLTPQQLAQIRLYLNFDMVASPNYALMIYDGDDSDAVGAPAGPPGSDEIEKLFERYFDALRQPHIGTDFTGRSDYGPFIEVGIPAGGLFTGAEGIKTPEEAKLFGGTAGEAYDPCYHQACDTIENINDKALALNTGAIATAAVVYAYDRDLPGGNAAARTQARTLTTTDGALVADIHDRETR